MVRIMKPLKPLLSIFVSNKRLDKYTAEVDAKEVISTIANVDTVIMGEQIC